jgi:light-regulated signal transduction histidine kinase (bacteriophytochrome)
VAGENTWCFHTEIPFDHVLDFEIDFDATCPDYPVSALCQYDLDQFCQESAAKALWTHEQIVYRYTVCENPYYIPPEEYRSRDETTLNPALMLEQTYELAQSRRRLQRREQRLEVISRILRHNIRNDLNVVTGNIELLQESDRLSEQDRQRLDTALQHVAGVCEIADQSQYVQDTLDRRHITDLALDSLLERVLDRIGDVYPGATVEIDGREGITVLADANLGDALFELFATVLGCQESDPPTASVSYEPTAPGTLRMHVEAPDPLMPASDRHALRRGTETQLEHGTGLGLWLVKWIVENGYGSLSFPQAETSLEIELRRIPE